MSNLITRRNFSKTMIALAASTATPIGWSSASGEVPLIPRPSAKISTPLYRAVSWWLVWDDLTWPNPELMDKIRHRADQCAASDVNCCLIFGAHFRWDFLPIWGRLHDELRFIADELHQRNILLFDHHSSVLTHRPRNREEALNIWERNRHHVPFYPSNKEAAERKYNGSFLNDWRMLDVESGEPIYLPAYNAEQYCMNNPDFQAAYSKYVKRLHEETAIDGLMSDDNIFYSNWQSCSCQHCQKRFKKEYGHTLPPVSDTGFWGNRNSKAFKDWIEMRFRSSGDFLIYVKDALPSGFPLLTCCSSSDGYYLPAYGMSYQDFIKNTNHVLLEMVGSTPSLAGTWDDRMASQLLHLGIARDHDVPCLGLGYGYFPDTAFFVWAVNKFLGSDCWLSTLKGRLNATQEELKVLPDDSEIVGEGYRWEKAHPQLFIGEVDTDIAVLFSRATRDYYGQVADDYSSDYSASCLELTRAGITCDVVTDIPEFSKIRCLVLSSAACLSLEERNRLAKFMADGGTVIATGPAGQYDEHANPIKKPWLEEFGINVKLDELSRPGGFPPYKNFKNPVKIAQCHVSRTTIQCDQAGWYNVTIEKGKLIWRPERITQKRLADGVIKILQHRDRITVKIKGLPAIWRLRQFRDDKRVLIHALPGEVETIQHPSLKNHMSNERIVEKLKFIPLTEEIQLESPLKFKRVTLHSPDLGESRSAKRNMNKQWVLDPSQISRYFIVECFK